MRRIAENRVALILSKDLGHCRRVLSGILSYIEAKGLDWRLQDAQPNVRAFDRVREWEPDGVIVHLFDRNLADQLWQLSCPIISTTDTLDNVSVPTVDVDNHAIGELAADYLMQLGYKHFGYFGSYIANFSQQRLGGYKERLAEHDFEVSTHDSNFLPRTADDLNWAEMHAGVAAWVSGLPKPVAIFCSNDIPARILCEGCRSIGLSVPEDVAILGVDNDESECRLASTALSSIETPAYAVGKQAAESLHRMLRRRNGRSMKRIAPLGVIRRASTEPAAMLDPRLSKAMQFIDQHAHLGVGIAELCEHTGLSRSSLERSFRSQLNSTIHEAIQGAQLELAKRLLIETQLSIAVVAERSGFMNTRKLARVFSDRVGLAPTAYRRQHLNTHSIS